MAAAVDVIAGRFFVGGALDGQSELACRGPCEGTERGLQRDGRGEVSLMAALQVGEFVANHEVELVGVETIDQFLAHDDLGAARRDAVGEGIAGGHDDQINALPSLVTANARFDGRVAAGTAGPTGTDQESTREPDGRGGGKPAGKRSTRLEGGEGALARRGESGDAGGLENGGPGGRDESRFHGRDAKPARAQAPPTPRGWRGSASDVAEQSRYREK